ncbi:MAG: hypothetical protein ACKO6A_08710 [Bacteroidota bacterium]
MENETVYWQIEGEHFIFPEHLKVIKSIRGNGIKNLISSLDNGIQIFLRGSLLENEEPFKKADIDLFVIYEDSSQLQRLKETFHSEDNFDIKLLQRCNFQDNYVFNALLQCRSLQICGEEYYRTKIKADKQFAWEHWIQYCPVNVPQIINTTDRLALIHFKTLTRCFGVLSFLRFRKFTRDISECINIAKMECPEAADALLTIRHCLENQKDEKISVHKLKMTLMNKFDEYFNCW